MTLYRILVPTDFSEYADAAFRYARELARALQAHGPRLHVVDNPLAADVWSSEVYTAEIAGLQVDLVRDVEERLKHWVPPRAENVSTEFRSGNPTRQILDAAREHGSNLIVMGTHGRTGPRPEAVSEVAHVA